MDFTLEVEVHVWVVVESDFCVVCGRLDGRGLDPRVDCLQAFLVRDLNLALKQFCLQLLGMRSARPRASSRKAIRNVLLVSCVRDMDFVLFGLGLVSIDVLVS